MIAIAYLVYSQSYDSKQVSKTLLCALTLPQNDNGQADPKEIAKCIEKYTGKKVLRNNFAPETIKPSPKNKPITINSVRELSKIKLSPKKSQIHVERRLVSLNQDKEPQIHQECYNGFLIIRYDESTDFKIIGRCNDTVN